MVTPSTFLDYIIYLAMMRKNNSVLNLVLSTCIFGVLALTAQADADCHEDLPDEFLDLAAACQNPTLPVFAPRLNAYPTPVRLLKAFSFNRTDLHTTSLRC